MTPGFSFSTTFKASCWPGQSLGRQTQGSDQVSLASVATTGIVVLLCARATTEATIGTAAAPIAAVRMNDRRLMPAARVSSAPLDIAHASHDTPPMSAEQPA